MNQHSEENYFVSMTDMMVGILFIFIIMVAFFAFKIQTDEVIPKYKHEQVVSKLKTEISELTEEIQRLKNLLSEVNKYELYAKKTIQAREKVLLSIKKTIESKGIVASVNLAQGVITIPGDTLFASGSSDLNDLKGANEKMSFLSEVITKNIGCYVFKENAPNNVAARCNDDNVFIETIFIEGHTDSIPVSRKLKDGSRDNLELSSRRATNSYKKIVETSPELELFENPIKQQILSTSAYGAQRPLRTNSSSQGRQENRRIDMRFIMFMPKDQEALDQFEKQLKVK